MKRFCAYWKEHAKWVILYGIGMLMMSMILFANGIAGTEIVYGVLLSLFLLTVFVGYDCIRYFRKQLRLFRMEAYMTNITEYLEEPTSLEEEHYQKMIYDMASEMVRQQNDATARMTDLREYYTMWVHQIKTPIAALRLLLQEKSGETDTSEEQDELFRIEQYVGMALQYMRLDSESTDFVFRQLNLDDIIKEAIHKYARLFVRKKVKLKYEDVNCAVLSDEKWLVFVIEQLLSNAIKYAPGGTVSVSMQEEGTLVIEDDGIGIRAEDLPRVMEKGYTGYNGHIDKRSTGIGLYLCYRIMNKMNHGIRIESEEGKGTRVFLSFPTNEKRDTNLTGM